MANGDIRAANNAVKNLYWCPSSFSPASTQCTGKWKTQDYRDPPPTKLGFDCWTVEQVDAYVHCDAFARHTKTTCAGLSTESRWCADVATKEECGQVRPHSSSFVDSHDAFADRHAHGCLYDDALDTYHWNEGGSGSCCKDDVHKVCACSTDCALGQCTSNGGGGSTAATPAASTTTTIPATTTPGPPAVADCRDVTGHPTATAATGSFGHRCDGCKGSGNPNPSWLCVGVPGRSAPNHQSQQDGHLCGRCNQGSCMNGHWGANFGTTAEEQAICDTLPPLNGASTTAAATTAATTATATAAAATTAGTTTAATTKQAGDAVTTLTSDAAPTATPTPASTTIAIGMNNDGAAGGDDAAGSDDGDDLALVAAPGDAVPADGGKVGGKVGGTAPAADGDGGGDGGDGGIVVPTETADADASTGGGGGDGDGDAAAGGADASAKKNKAVVPVVVVLLLLLLLLLLVFVYQRREENAATPGQAAGHVNPIYGQHTATAGAYDPAAYADPPSGPVNAAAGAGADGGRSIPSVFSRGAEPAPAGRVVGNDTYGSVVYDSTAAEPFSNPSIGVYDNANDAAALHAQYGGADAMYAEPADGPALGGAGRTAANATYMEAEDAPTAAAARMAANATYGDINASNV